MAKRRPRKPTGEIASRTLRLRPGEPASLGLVERFKLPEDKVAAETAVMDATASLLAQLPGLPWYQTAHHQAPENGPDFELVLPQGGIAYAELAEIAPLTGPYSDCNRLMPVADYVRHVVQLVSSKQQKYVSRGYAPLMLVLYVSHDAFTPDPEVTACIGDALLGIDTSAFDTILLTLFAYDGSPLLARLKPDPVRPTIEQRISTMNRNMALADPSQATVIAGGMREDGYVDVTVQLLFPKGTDLKDLEALQRPGSVAAALRLDLPKS